MTIAWFLLLPIAAILGWTLRGYVRQSASPHTPDLTDKYFLGLNYLLNEQADKAIDVFLQMIAVDNDTVEMHLTLGNLFRRRGEVERAIRIHQNLIARPQLEKPQRAAALLSLGQDYLSAGMYDRAEGIFKELIALGEHRSLAARALMTIYEHEKDWQQAIQSAQQLAAATHHSQQIIIAQYYCELAQEAQENKQYMQAKRMLKKALHADKHCVRANVLLAKNEEKQQKYLRALQYYQRIETQDARYLVEVLTSMVHCYQALKKDKALITYLTYLLKTYPQTLLALQAADHLQKMQHEINTEEMIAHAPQSWHSLYYLWEWHVGKLSELLRHPSEKLRAFAQELLKTQPNYRCEDCGFSSKQLYWRCPGCKEWSTLKPL